MPIRVAINGFGRIGRLTFRNLMSRSSEFEVVAVNDLTDNKMLATLLKYDSTHGRYGATVEYDDRHLIVDGKKILALEQRNPAELPWGDLGVDVVVEHIGADTWDKSLHCLSRNGRLVTCGATSGSIVQTDLWYLFGKHISIHGSYMGEKGELLKAFELFKAGRMS